MGSLFVVTERKAIFKMYIFVNLLNAMNRKTMMSHG